MGPGPDWHPHFGRIGGTSLAAWLAAYPDHGPPVRSLLLATEERTGSEYLCQLLGATGQMGRPSEYLNTYWMRCFIPDYPEDIAAQVTIAHRVGTTPNRFFAMKLHAVQFARLLTGSTVAAAFPAPVFVRLHRRDLLAQAISLYRARYGSQYHAHTPPARAVAYDGAAIGQMMRELVLSRARWELYFGGIGVTPLAIAYEDLAADPMAAVQAIGRYAGMQVAPGEVAIPLRKQHDDISETWRQRFLAENRDRNVFDTV